MAEDLSGPLREIADLLRQRVEQTAAMTRLAEERMAKFPPVTPPELPDFAKMEAVQEAASRAREEKTDRRREEDVAFRERLLAALEQQNALLARLVDRVAP